MTSRNARRTSATVGVLALTLLIWGVAVPAPSQNASSPFSPQAARELYAQKIQPLLETKCLVCHRGEMAQSGLDLSTRAGILHSGSRGPAIVPGNAKASLLVKLISHEDEPRMPPGGEGTRLSKEMVASISDWIQAGAPYGEAPETTVSDARVDSLNASAAAPSDPAAKLFDEHVRPAFEAKCLNCHGPNDTKRAGLDISTRDAILKGGDDGPAIVPGKSAESLLIKRLKHEVQPGMPFMTDKLAEDVIAKIAEWVDAGAPYSDKPLRVPGEHELTKSNQPHWAFQPPVAHAVPKVKNSAWVRNPIDSFIAAEQDRHGLKPLPEADKRVLLRRVYVDLIGLPPTPEETKAFLADRSPNAYEKVVDRLLADQRYGERWGRHWMDVWRYSDPDGYAGRVDYSQKHIWQWRDWIIESINQDKHYDRMVTEMLAADEIAPTDENTLRATGYLARSWYRFNRNSWLQDTVDHTAAAFLGVSLRCARCHDHKYDPFQQEEYYRFRAFFEPYDVRIDPVPGQPDLKKNGVPRVYESQPRESVGDNENPGVNLPAIFGETRRFIRGEETQPDEKVLTPGVPKALGGALGEIHAVELPVEASYPSLLPFVQEDLIKVAKADIAKAEGDLDRATRALAYAKDRVSKVSTAPKTAEQEAHPSAANPATAAVSFDKDIKPIFEKRCFACHNAQTNRSGLSLETVEAVLAGGNRNGPSVLPRNTEASPLLMYLRGEKNPRMPVGGEPLSDEQITMIANWINQLPEEDPAAALSKAETNHSVAEKELAAARANLPALEARIAADKAKFQPAQDTNADALAATARKAERQAHLLKAEAGLLRAQAKLSEALAGPAPADDQGDKDREKKITAAKRDLDAAQKALGQSMESYTHIGTVYPKQSSGRRTALAQWIIDPKNPLTARVAVNHMWLRHFGKAIVPTVENFGISGQKPSHPELLDWLALKFIEDGWSTKSMHRLMVTSATYRMQSTAAPKDPNREKDADNRYLWHANSRRMEAEAVRDSVLYVAGQLDTKIGGPDENDVNSHRRGMYFKQTPYAQTEFLQLFDVANPGECYQRSESIIPQQALALANSALSLNAARELASQLSEQTGAKATEPVFVAAAFEKVLGRPATADEARMAAKFLTSQSALLAEPAKLTAFGVASASSSAPASDPKMRARENLVHVLLNHNDFVTVR